MNAIFVSLQVLSLGLSLQAWEIWQLPHKNRTALRFLVFLRILILGLVLLKVLSPIFVLAVALSLVLQFFLLRGPYCGGSDSMYFYVALSLGLWGWGHDTSRELLVRGALGLIAAQLSLSYLRAGWVKAMQPGWWTGQELEDILGLAHYEVPSGIRRFLNHKPQFRRCVSGGLLIFELSFPIVFLYPQLLPFYLSIGILFHLANVHAFGLTHFFFAWVAAYPLLVALLT